MKNPFFIGVLAFLAVASCPCVFGAGATNAAVKPPMIEYLSPQDEAKTFFCEDNYKLELVLSDPIISDPVVTAFDGDGRMYVAEMRSFMTDADGTDERARTGRISLHWSSKHNGVYDKHTVFVDKLLLPRMILPLSDGVLVNETDSDDIWLYRDTKGKGVADTKVLFSPGGPRGGNIEHQPSGLIWDLDNWMYMAVNSYRIRMRGGKLVREGTASNMGQWGLSQDDYGKLWFVNAGYEVGPLNFEEPIVYGAFNFVEQTEPDWTAVWPLIGLPDFQGGSIRIRPGQNSLNHFTATCGSEIYRGDRLPADLRGDLFFAEPVGRLIRRAKVEVKEGFTRLRNAYNQAEFIRSTDPNFRPVNLANAPDGSMYICDMYRGIIQERDWVNPGSYLRGVVDQYHMAQNFGRGRIWRLTHKDFKPGPQPRMLEEPPVKLVSHLEHPNGWWRDTAQKLLILRGDKSVAPALVKMAQSNPNYLARIHAIWTLEGLDALEPSLVREKFKDEHPQVRIAAIRASETLYKAGDQSFAADISALAKDPDPNVVIQVMMTASMLKWPDWDRLISETTAANPAFGVKKMGTQMVPTPPPPKIAANPGTPIAPAPAPPPPRYSADEKKVLERGEIIYKELCFVCHGLDGKGTPLAGGKPGATMGPPLAGSKTITGHLDDPISVVLKGLSGPIDGKTYDAQMVPMESNDDAWVSAVLSFIRNSFGNHSTLISTNDVARVREAIKNRTNVWTMPELQAAWPQPLTNRAQWKLTASHNPAKLPYAVDGNPATRYDTGTPQKPGMWLKIELPEETEVTGVELDCGTSEQDYPRRYKVDLSDDGTNWGGTVAGGDSKATRNEIVFPAQRSKFVRVMLLDSDPVSFWSIHELNVLKAPGAPETAQPAASSPSTNGTNAAPTPVPAQAPVQPTSAPAPVSSPPAPSPPPSAEKSSGSAN